MTDTTILVVEDDPALREAFCDTLALSGYRPRAVGEAEAALALLAGEQADLVITDVHLPGMDGHELLRQVQSRFGTELPVVVVTAYGSVEKAVEAMRDGARDYLVKPFEAEVLVNMVARHVRERAPEPGCMVAEDPRSRELAVLARRVAESDATVFITGESGTGKEVLARYVHACSRRAQRPFVAINCAAIPENMLEATLFGYEKGAFTGAYKACPGKFEQAQGGTLLLDEISEMDLGLQAKLLRVLQEREVERLGGQKLIELDVRVLATSNRDLRAEVKAGRFREDLFYRLNVFPLALPPLRERAADIVPLAERLLERHARREGRGTPQLSAEAAQRLRAHAWPGNVRELDNAMQRALILQPGGCIGAADLHLETVASTAGAFETVAEEPAAEGLSADLQSREWNLILETLRTVTGNRKAAAERLGISQRTLRYKLARMRDAGVPIPGDRLAEHA